MQPLVDAFGDLLGGSFENAGLFGFVGLWSPDGTITVRLVLKAINLRNMTVTSDRMMTYMCCLDVCG